LGRIEDGVFHASIHTVGDIIRIEPLASHYGRDSHIHASNQHTHVVYRLSDMDFSTKDASHTPCGVQDNGHSHDHESADGGLLSSLFKPLIQQRNDTHSRSRRTGAGGDATKTTCGVWFQADQRYYESQGASNFVTTTNQLIAYAEDVNRIYKVSYLRILEGRRLGCSLLLMGLVLGVYWSWSRYPRRHLPYHCMDISVYSWKSLQGTCGLEAVYYVSPLIPSVPPTGLGWW
jgi:hypothetical protein